MRWLHFILSHSFFISFCAVALCFQTYLLLGISANIYVYGLVFFATLSSYNFYWLISNFHFNFNAGDFKIYFTERFSNLFVLVIAGSGMLFCLYFLPVVLPVVLIAVFLTILYSLPLWPLKKLAFTRKAGFLKTILLAFTWTFVTVIIPVQQSGMVYSNALGILFTARFLFMLMLCVIFDSRDIQVDKIRSLSSLATDVSHDTLRLIMSVVFICFLFAGFIFRYYFDDNSQIIAFFITGLMTLLVYRLSLKKQGYFFYYFLVDGLMLFSATASYVASI